MNDFDTTIFNEFSSMFPMEEIRNDPTLSCLAFGIECEKGWYPIIYDTLKEIQKINPKIQIDQIKEKFGGLRIYWHGGSTDEEYNLISNIIDRAEEQAEKTCELCGKPATQTTKYGWIRTVCEEHSKT